MAGTDRRRIASVTKVGVSASLVIIPLVAATWFIPPAFPLLLRQFLLFVWGAGAILIAERLLFSETLREAVRRIGFVQSRTPAFVVALVNGITEEVIHRGFVFGHLRRERTFAAAATLSAMLFAAQHLYLLVTMGWTVGGASVLLAALLAFPLAFVFERGGNSIGGPAILHTSSNAPVIILALPEDFVATTLVPHMGVILMSLYLVFVARSFLDRRVDVNVSAA